MSGEGREADTRLVADLAVGDVAALAALYDRYGALAYALAMRVVGDPGKAEDVVQEAFLNVWRKAGTFDPARGSLRSWLLATVRNRAVDSLRGRAGRERGELGLEEILELPASPAHDPWAEVSRAFERDAVREALDRLPSEQRQSVELAYYAGYTYREIAESERVPLSTVKGRMRLALEKLHSYLAGKGLHDDL